MKSLPDAWAAQSRLRAIERAAWWRGVLGRNDLIEQFSLSPAQATNDLRRYQELNPTALNYDLSEKRYRGSRAMKCVLHEPKLREGLAAFLGGSGLAVTRPGFDGPNLAEAALPERGAQPQVERHVLLAALNGLQVKVKYHSASSGQAKERVLAPHAFGWEGSRWHARCFDYDSGEYRDFVLGRIERADWPKDAATDLPKDADWDKVETLRLALNPKLDDGQRKALAMDYGIGRDGVLKIPVRRAMRGYQLKMLGLEIDGKPARRDFELA